MNMMAQLKFEVDYNYVAVQHISHNAIKVSPHPPF